MMEQKWYLKKDSQCSNEKNKEDRDKEEGSKDGPRESQKKVEEGTPSSTSC